MKHYLPPHHYSSHDKIYNIEILRADKILYTANLKQFQIYKL